MILSYKDKGVWKNCLEYILRAKMRNRIKPRYVSQHFRIVLTKNNLKLIRFHELGHYSMKKMNQKANELFSELCSTKYHTE